jgi:hypothetical protein
MDLSYAMNIDMRRTSLGRMEANGDGADVLRASRLRLKPLDFYVQKLKHFRTMRPKL